MEAGFLLNDIITFDCPPALIEERGARPSDPAPSGPAPRPPMPKPREGVADVLRPAKSPPPPPPVPPLAEPGPGRLRRAAFFILYRHIILKQKLTVQYSRQMGPQYSLVPVDSNQEHQGPFGLTTSYTYTCKNCTPLQNDCLPNVHYIKNYSQNCSRVSA